MTIFVLQAFGQWKVIPISKHSSNKIASSKASLAPGDTLDLPFWDDFSTSFPSPDTTLWLVGNDVFVSPTIGIDPVTINVATFDGSTGQGFPHNDGIRTSEKTDSLVSKPINLSGRSPSDSVVLSFFWQIQGLGNLPGRRDKLTIHFKDSANQWSELQDEALLGEENVADSSFHFKDISIKDLKYFHSGFQFMFQSVGSTSGPFDIWNIDYVSLQSGKDDLDIREFYQDLAVSTKPTSIFKDYTMIPRYQLEFFTDTIFSEISYYLTNLDSIRRNIVYEYTLMKVDTIIEGEYIGNTLVRHRDPDDNGLLDHREFFEATVPPLSSSVFDTIPGKMNLVSIGSIESTIDTGTPFANNNSSYFEFEIDEVLAYDDGTAELSAGFNSKAVQLAVHYKIATMDTLSHVDIAFPRVSQIPDNNRFKISIATRLTQNDSAVISTQEFTRPDTIFSVDEFISFELQQPVQVSDVFYVMFEQSANTYFPIGLDVNTKNGDKIWLNFGNGWVRNDLSEVTGSLMIRPRFGPNNLVVNSVADHKISKINIYPNPADNRIFLEGEFDHFQLVDLSGKVIIRGNQKEIDSSFLQEGLYLIRFLSGHEVATQKILISH